MFVQGQNDTKMTSLMGLIDNEIERNHPKILNSFLAFELAWAMIVCHACADLISLVMAAVACILVNSSTHWFDCLLWIPYNNPCKRNMGQDKGIAPTSSQSNARYDIRQGNDTMRQSHQKVTTRQGQYTTTASRRVGQHYVGVSNGRCKVVSCQWIFSAVKLLICNNFVVIS